VSTARNRACNPGLVPDIPFDSLQNMNWSCDRTIHWPSEVAPPAEV
jgi:hypothetical protein